SIWWSNFYKEEIMNRKSEQYTKVQNDLMPESRGVDIHSTAKQTLDTAIDTINDNKLLIGAIAGACGAAIFLLATDSGRSIRTRIQDRVLDLYDYISDQVIDGVDRMRGIVEDMTSRSSSEIGPDTSSVKHTA